MKLLVTGGAGFIGSHLIDRLMAEGHSVFCVDNLSLGRAEFIQPHRSDKRFGFQKLDLVDRESLGTVFAGQTFDCVFHLTANSDIQLGRENPRLDFQNGFLTTLHVLECMQKASVKNLVFASTSAIYGEREGKLAEDSGPLRPCSLYGAAKLSAEAFISAYCENFGMKSWIYRFPNVVGPRATHGAIYDFVHRLNANPKELVVLGDGKQSKPYVFVSDLVEAMLFAWRKAPPAKVNCFNLGNEDSVTVREIAEIVIEEMGLTGVSLKFTGGDRGWVGDVPRFAYDLSRIHRLGWKAKHSSREAVRLAAHAIADSAKRKAAA